ncbi:DUF397 domain-containing protein [Streptomyces lividans]|uniref:DUF397 domain-containing protein n=3 Tax=Streptomyces TaxID=1883 RepID=A0A7U9DWD3_STRLI|nr:MULTISPECIES: DUF397 domain-containing protein [Streptomyces]QSJ07916.1 hypothetical protein SLIVDG2_06965 [Streptomyces lividans]AIJ12408.1 hypothetical protein SLIV_06965 [Streptomyces lividans TK24]EFD65758.1 conserved hypothetical protein [Streptomyces lividans TK24]EOY51329.1 hypothetical protein SLI_6623 [Streptomyces lividans 1326]KKD11981.1 toxin [Streptomyces sp. WM6391]
MNTTELAWFKSSYSSGGDGDCVEIALSWHKSSYSSSGDGDCVEVAARPDAIHIRDSKAPHGDQLAVSPTAWARFLTYTTDR